MLINSNKTQDLVLSGNISLTYKTNAHSEITFERAGVGGGGWGEGVSPTRSCIQWNILVFIFLIEHFRSRNSYQCGIRSNTKHPVNIEIFEITCSRVASKDVSPCD